VVLDLEDSVPHALKHEARDTVAGAIPGHADGRARLYVRTNRGAHAYDVDDLRAVVQPGLDGIFVSKAEDPTDIELLSRFISEIETAKGMAVGSTRLIVPIETAQASQYAFE